MLRGYAIGQGAGTQFFTLMPLILIFGMPGELPKALLMGTGCAGSIIEHSIVLKQLGRVVDFLNTNIWHGDPKDYWNTKLALTPFHDLLDATLSTRGSDGKTPLAYAIDEAIDPNAAAY